MKKYNLMKGHRIFGEKIFPNLFLPGAAKSGTTTLSFLMNKHSEILLSYKKEPNFFNHSRFSAGYEDYIKENFLSWNGEKYLMDASQSYMLPKYVPKRIKLKCKAPKIIFILREPIQRAYSAWSMWATLRPGLRCDTFEEEVLRNYEVFNPFDRFKYEWEIAQNSYEYGGLSSPHILEQGFYTVHIKNYISEFGRKNVLIVSMKELENTNNLLNKIFNFLELDNIELNEDMNLNSSGNKISLNRILEESPTSRKIMSIYHEMSKELYDLTGIDFHGEWYS